MLNFYEETLIKNHALPQSLQSQSSLDELAEFLQSNWENRAVFYDDGEIRAHSDCSRGFSNARKVASWAKLPKAKIEYKEDYLPYSLLSNLEFISKRMLCSDEFKGFKIEPVVEDCDDKYIFLAKVDGEYYGKKDYEESEEGLE